MIEISVIIPTYGRPDSAARVARILAADIPERAEIVVVWQGALPPQTDTSHVRHIHLHTPNLPAARNAGIDASTGTIVLFLDDDITPMPGLVARHIALHAAHAGCVAIAGGVRDIHNQGTKPRVVQFDLPTLSYVCDYGLSADEDIDGCPGGHTSFKRTALAQVRFDPWFRGNAHFEEIDVALRLKRRGERIRFCSSVWIDHHLEPRGGCRSELTATAFQGNQFYNRGFCFGKHVSLRHLPVFLTKQRHDLEYFSRRGDAHDHRIVSAALAGLAWGLTAGMVRRHVGDRRYR